MRTSTFLIASVLISFSSASLIGRNNGGVAEVQRPASGQTFSEYLAEAGVQQAGRPIARRYIRRDRVRRQIPQLPRLPTEGVPEAQPQLPGQVPTVPEVATSSAQAEVPATTVPAAVTPSTEPVVPVIPGVPGAPEDPGAPGGPGDLPVFFPPGSGDLPDREPTGPVEDPLKVEGDLPPGFSVIGSVPAPSGVVGEPVESSPAPSAVIPTEVATAEPVPVSSGPAGLPSSLPPTQPELPVPSVPVEVSASSAPAVLPAPSTPAQVVPVVPGAEDPGTAAPSFGNVQPVVSSIAAAEPSLPALPVGFSVISSNIPAAAAATAGTHGFNRNPAGSQNGQGNAAATTINPGSQIAPTALPEGFKVISEGVAQPTNNGKASATLSIPDAGVTSTGLPGLNNGSEIVGNMPAGFKVIEAPQATTLIRRVRRSIPRSEEELMYRYGSSK